MNQTNDKGTFSLSRDKSIIAYYLGSMQRFNMIYTQAWYVGMPLVQKNLVRISLELYAREERLHSQFDDYSFIVFPMAKAYEGYLKYFLYQSNLISRDAYYDKHFRIGRALNPDIHPNRRDTTWLYDQVAQSCGTNLARQLWETWLECRNRVFHFFPDASQQLTLAEAAKRLEMMAQTIELTTHCEVRFLSQ
jgi:hypothetical protein